TDDFKTLNPFKNIALIQAQKYNPNIKIGDKIKKEIESIHFGRIDAQLARNIIHKRVKNAEKELNLKDFNNTKLMFGIVKKITNEEIIITINDDIDGSIKKTNLIPNESFKIGDKVKACMIKSNKKHQEFQLSRTSNDMLSELLKLEIPEIKSEYLEIKDIARDPGIKAKVAIKANVKDIDPIGACIGMRGKRIQNISNELYGEKIDIINWDQNLFKYIINIFFPIEIKKIEIDEKIRLINISVKKESLSKVIGKQGQNIKLITKLIKWNLNINEYLK
ncbi:MAG TPA: transcription termination factor NusA, partial [Candidatus Azoamicus sp.]